MLTRITPPISETLAFQNIFELPSWRESTQFEANLYRRGPFQIVQFSSNAHHQSSLFDWLGKEEIDPSCEMMWLVVFLSCSEFFDYFLWPAGGVDCGCDHGRNWIKIFVFIGTFSTAKAALSCLLSNLLLLRWTKMIFLSTKRDTSTQLIFSFSEPFQWERG